MTRYTKLVKWMTLHGQKGPSKMTKLYSKRVEIKSTKFTKELLMRRSNQRYQSKAFSIKITPDLESGEFLLEKEYTKHTVRIYQVRRRLIKKLLKYSLKISALCSKIGISQRWEENQARLSGKPRLSESIDTIVRHNGAMKLGSLPIKVPIQLGLPQHYPFRKRETIREVPRD